MYLALCILNPVCAHGLCKDNRLFVLCLESTKYFHMSAIGGPTWPLWKFPCNQNRCILQAFNPGGCFSCWELVAVAARATEGGRMAETWGKAVPLGWGILPKGASDRDSEEGSMIRLCLPEEAGLLLLCNSTVQFPLEIHGQDSFHS